MKKGIYTKQNQALCDWLRTRRAAKGLSVRELALRLHVSHSKVSRVETGGQMLNIVQFMEWVVALQANPHEVIDKIWVLEMEEQTRATVPSWEKAVAADPHGAPYGPHKSQP
jgi:transcriptional regulator with XRE-family HTH domain